MFFCELRAAFFNISISELYCKARGTRWHSWLRHALQAGMSWVRWGHWNFSMTVSFQPQYGPGIDSASDWNEDQELSRGGGCVGLTTLSQSCGDCQKIWVTQPPGTLRVCPGLYKDCFTCYCKAQAVRGWPVIAAAYVRARPCGIWGGKSGTGTGLSASTSVFPFQIIPPALHFHDLSLVGCDAV